MGKLLLLVALGVLGYLIWKGLTARDKRHGGRGGSDSSSASSAVQPMVQCLECGVHLPKSEAYVDGTRYFCSNEHERAYAARSSR